MYRHLAVFAALVAATHPSFAVETKTWVQNEQSDFEKGTLTKLSLRSDGRLSLAPTLRTLFDAATPYLWALAEDSKGNLYTGGGGPSASSAKLFVIDPAGKSKAVAELPGMEIHAIAVNRNDQVFAATAPDGKVYRIGRDGKADVFYDPKAKYIWALAFDSKGNLYVATGDDGQVHRVTPDGKGSVFFRTEETHARSMIVDSADNLIVGTEPGGLILRVSPAGEGFVVYQAAKREVTALAVAKDGTIYAAAVGNKTGSTSAPSGTQSTVSIPPIPAASVTVSGGGRTAAGAGSTVSTTTHAPASSITASATGGTEVYRIDRDNYPRKIWSNNKDIAYAIALDANGRPLIGTGNQGKLYLVDSDVNSTLLLTAQPTQITNLLTSHQGRLYAACGNTGEIEQIGPGVEQEGTFESEPFDVGFFSYWGRLSYKGDSPNGKVAFATRSGNLDRPQKNWSPWAPVDLLQASRVTSPSARFLQYRATLTADGQGRSPDVTQVEIAYQAKNVPPSIDDIDITPPNYRFPAPPTTTSSAPTTLTLPAMGQRKRAQSGLSLDLSSQTMNYAKGFAGVRWQASDPNGDELLYTVEIRGNNENTWKLLRDKVKERYTSWDSTAFPDGWYVLRVTASDAPSNPRAEALTNSLESEPFPIDNTPPEITGLTGTRTPKGATAQWKAKDAYSTIDKAEYSVDGGEWSVIEPTTRLSDARELQYSLSLSELPPGEHTIAVRVEDEFDNQSVAKVVVR